MNDATRKNVISSLKSIEKVYEVEKISRNGGSVRPTISTWSKCKF